VINRAANGLTRLSEYLAALAGLLIIGIMLVQLVVVLLRYVFSIGVAWGLDLLVYLFLVASLLPLLFVILSNHNVRVDVFYQSYSLSLRNRLDRISLAALLFPVTAYTAYVSWAPALNSWRLLEASPTLDGLPGYFLLKTLQLLVFASLSLIAVLLAARAQPWPARPLTIGKDS